MIIHAREADFSRADQASFGLLFRSAEAAFAAACDEQAEGAGGKDLRRGASAAYAPACTHQSRSSSSILSVQETVPVTHCRLLPPVLLFRLFHPAIDGLHDTRIIPSTEFPFREATQNEKNLDSGMVTNRDRRLEGDISSSICAEPCTPVCPGARVTPDIPTSQHPDIQGSADDGACEEHRN